MSQARHAIGALTDKAKTSARTRTATTHHRRVVPELLCNPANIIAALYVRCRSGQTTPNAVSRMRVGTAPCGRAFGGRSRTYRQPNGGHTKATDIVSAAARS